MKHFAHITRPMFSSNIRKLEQEMWIEYHSTIHVLTYTCSHYSLNQMKRSTGKTNQKQSKCDIPTLIGEM